LSRDSSGINGGFYIYDNPLALPFLYEIHGERIRAYQVRIIQRFAFACEKKTPFREIVGIGITGSRIK
jgi:hypothetical protein